MKFRYAVLLLIGFFAFSGCAGTSGIDPAVIDQQLIQLTALVELQKEQIAVTKDLLSKQNQSYKELRESNKQLEEMKDLTKKLIREVK